MRAHPAFGRLFRPGRLTFGLLAPLEGYPDQPIPTLQNQEALVRRADELGIAALWLRDVPFYDPNFGDVGQIWDPMVYAGWLAAETRQIAIGTAGMILPLREPLLLAKQAASLDHLSGSRFLLGLASGDRPGEFPSMGLRFEDRVERYREALAVLRAATEGHFNRHAGTHYGSLDGSLDLLPKPRAPRLPLIAIGRGGQDLEWIASHVDAWIWHGSNPQKMADVVPAWRAAVGTACFKPYGYGAWFELLDDPEAPLEPGRVLRAGRKALVALWKDQERLGVSHVVLNLKPARRPAAEMIEELAQFVLPEFPAEEIETAYASA
jgi:luciferase-type oxidoreductase